MPNLRRILGYTAVLVALVLLGGLFSVSRIFSLSRDDVALLIAANEICSSLSRCPLKEGDILIRRQINPHTRILEKFDMYLNHVAYYLGNDEIVAAVGDYPDSSSEIIVENLSKSDWTGTTTEVWIVVRPNAPRENISNISSRLRAIAIDDRYSFGLFRTLHQKTCTNFIYDELVSEGIFTKSERHILTPDFMFDSFSRSSNFTLLTHGTGPLK